MAWLKAMHLIAAISWMAGLLYLPRLFVYHAQCEDKVGQERFKIMERRLYRGIMTPAGIGTVLFGLWLLLSPGIEVWMGSYWLLLKLILVLGLIAHHILCGHFVAAFRRDQNKHSHQFYRWFNEVPAVLMIGIVILASVRPF